MPQKTYGTFAIGNARAWTINDGTTTVFPADAPAGEITSVAPARLSVSGNMNAASSSVKVVDYTYIGTPLWGSVVGAKTLTRTTPNTLQGGIGLTGSSSTLASAAAAFAVGHNNEVFVITATRVSGASTYVNLYKWWGFSVALELIAAYSQATYPTNFFVAATMHPTEDRVIVAFDTRLFTIDLTAITPEFQQSGTVSSAGITGLSIRALTNGQIEVETTLGAWSYTGEFITAPHPSPGLTDSTGPWGFCLSPAGDYFSAISVSTGGAVPHKPLIRRWDRELIAWDPLIYLTKEWDVVSREAFGARGLLALTWTPWGVLGVMHGMTGLTLVDVTGDTNFTLGIDPINGPKWGFIPSMGTPPPSSTTTSNKVDGVSPATSTGAVAFGAPLVAQTTYENYIYWNDSGTSDTIASPTVIAKIKIDFPETDLTGYGMELITRGTLSQYASRAVIYGVGAGQGYTLKVGDRTPDTILVLAGAKRGDVITIYIRKSSRTTSTTYYNARVNEDPWLSDGESSTGGVTDAGAIPTNSVRICFGSCIRGTGWVNGQTAYLAGFVIGTYSASGVSNPGTPLSGYGATGGGVWTYLGGSTWKETVHTAHPTGPRSLAWTRRRIPGSSFTAAETGVFRLPSSALTMFQLSMRGYFFRGLTATQLKIGSYTYDMVPSDLAAVSFTQSGAWEGNLTFSGTIPRLGDLVGALMVGTFGAARIVAQIDATRIRYLTTTGSMSTGTISIIPREILLITDFLETMEIEIPAGKTFERIEPVDFIRLGPAWAHGWTRTTKAKEQRMEWANGFASRRSLGTNQRVLVLGWTDAIDSPTDEWLGDHDGAWLGVAEALPGIIADAAARGVPSVIIAGEKDARNIVWGREKLFYGWLPSDVEAAHTLGDEESPTYRIQSLTITEVV